MLEPEIDPYAIPDIHERVDRLMRDLGWPEPPLRLEDVRALQQLDLTYYSKADLNLLDEMAHKARLAGNSIATSATKMVKVVQDHGLRGLLVRQGADKTIYIDDDAVVPLKRRFVIAHEITHDLLDWHRALLMGDNETTLSPTCHQAMEAEANYGGRRLLFMGSRFREEAKSSDFTWKTVEEMKKRFGNTLTTTLWHLVCERDPTEPVFGMVSRHPHYPEIGARDDGSDVGYFFRSQAFRTRFGNVEESDAFAALSSYANMKKRGPIGEDICPLIDVNGDAFDFQMFSFSNTYDLLTFGVCVGRHKTIVGF